MSTFKRDSELDLGLCVCGMSYGAHKTLEGDDGKGIRDGIDPFEECPGNGYVNFIAPPAGIDGTLEDRAERYGSYVDQCSITQDLKTIMHCSNNWSVLASDMKESLDMIASKISRILNGDSLYIDSWHDIAGYARLIEKRLEEGAKTND